MIINSSYFTKGLRKVQDATAPASSEGATLASLKPDAMAVNAMLDEYIEEYQHRFMRGVFGEKLATELEDYAGQGQTEAVVQEYEDMLDHVRTALADYVLYWYLRGTNQQASALGVTVFENKNRNADPSDRQAAVWNDMVDELRSLREWASENSPLSLSVEMSMLTKISASWV